jgi:hypothetical protein
MLAEISRAEKEARRGLTSGGIVHEIEEVVCFGFSGGELGRHCGRQAGRIGSFGWYSCDRRAYSKDERRSREHL